METRVACIWFSEPVAASKLAEMFLRFSPQICLRKDRAIFVEIGKCHQLYSEQSFLVRANYLLKKHGHSACIRVGENITNSLVLAKTGAACVDKLPLEVLVDFTDPFDKDEVLQKSVLKLINAFQDLGIESIAQFKHIPEGELISRFGIVGRFVHQRVHQRDFISWPLWKPEEVITEKKEFSFFYGELEPLLFELKGQLDAIFARLSARKLRMTKLRVQVCCEKLSVIAHPKRTFNFEFFAPQSSAKSTLKILKERLTREFEKQPIKSPIEELSTTVIKTVPFEFAQKNIFNNDEEKLEQVYSLHNQLVETLGADNVYQAELTEDRRPEKSWRKKFDTPHVPSEQPALTETIPERPTYLCRTPVKVEVTAGYIHIGKRRRRILGWDNFREKIKGGWFERPSEVINDTYDRTYFLVDLDGPQRVFIFETKDKEYFLHGYYG